jgi:Protein of unknown function (DUF559)
MADVIVGTGEDGADVVADDLAAKFLLKLRNRQEAVWAVVCHGRVVVDVYTTETESEEDGAPRSGEPSECTVYVPIRYMEWWSNSDACLNAVRAAASSAWNMGYYWAQNNVKVDWLLEVPDDLQYFVTENTDRPKPRRYNTTAVQLFDRDGVAWLTAPEAKLYDVLKQANWLFIPQPPFLAGEEFDRRADFLIFWRNKAAWAVIVEVDSDAYHLPSQRTHDEAREREFQSRGFQFLRFSVKEVNASPTDVLKKIAEFCTKRFGS